MIWCIDRKATHNWLPKRLKKRLTIETSDVFTAEMLEQEAATMHEFDTLGAEPFVAFFEPPSLDERIVNQFAVLSLLSDPRLWLDRWRMHRPDIAPRLIIPARLKWEIRDRLDEATVTERVLFLWLELDGLCRWLTRYYMSRHREEQTQAG